MKGETPTNKLMLIIYMTRYELEDIYEIANLQYDWGKIENSTIMISGGTGFIGSALIDVIRYRNMHFDSKIKVISISRHAVAGDDTIQSIQADINDPIEYCGNIDYIIHLASNTHPRQYADDPVGTITTNIIGCNNLLQLAKKQEIKRFLLASSVEVYGEGSVNPMNELYSGYINCNLARSGYNEAKRTCESLCQAYKQQYGIDSVIVRLARVFGPDKKSDSKAMAQFMDKAVAGEDIILKSNGDQLYSYIYVADAVSGILKVLLEGISGEAYNVAYEDEGITLGEYAKFVADLAGKKVVYAVENNESVSRASFALMDSSKIKALGWEPRYNVCDGLRRTFQIKKMLSKETTLR